jgi:glycine dehydrogenase subunit 2
MGIYMSKVKLIFERSVEGRIGHIPPQPQIKDEDVAAYLSPNLFRQENCALPQVSEGEVVRHYTYLSTLNFGVDTGYYPLGSCTMKYNPKINEDVASLANFSHVHPFTPASEVQGTLALLAAFEKALCEIFGYKRFSFQPVAGAHGEYAGMMIIRAYFEKLGENNRSIMLIPDSAHGTNPASAAMAGFKVKTVKSNARGGVDVEHLKELLSDEVAGFMLTNPSTLGLFEDQIVEIAKLIHEQGALMYYDGANANALLGLVRPGEMGFDVAHINLHKTFSTPHGGGGPGSGPVGVSERLVPFLPAPVIDQGADGYFLNYDLPDSIGKVSTFYGNIGVVLKAYTYVLTLGKEGLGDVTQNAIINANYLMKALEQKYEIPYKRWCMHEFVISAKKEKAKHNVKALDIAKRLIDYGYHPPTIYFPLIVPECLMIEPTETESQESLDEFVVALNDIHAEIEKNSSILLSAPNNVQFGRLDEVKAVKEPRLIYNP